MVDILELSKGIDVQVNNHLLLDGTWQKADFYDFSSNSIFWNRASFICLSKKCTLDAAVALIYLLQKEAKTLTLWQGQWGESTPSLQEFIKALVAWGRFSHTKGEAFPVELFWKQFDGTIEGISSETDFEFSKNGIVELYKNLLLKQDILQVVCFDDTWNEQNFLIETTTNWILYHWITAA
jgi:hypothetical protein